MWAFHADPYCRRRGILHAGPVGEFPHVTKHRITDDPKIQTETAVASVEEGEKGIPFHLPLAKRVRAVPRGIFGLASQTAPRGVLVGRNAEEPFAARRLEDEELRRRRDGPLFGALRILRNLPRADSGTGPTRCGSGARRHATTPSVAQSSVVQKRCVAAAAAVTAAANRRLSPT